MDELLKAFPDHSLTYTAATPKTADVIDLDGSVENADWIKFNSWDLPPYRSPEFFAIWPIEQLEEFKKLPVHKGAVARGLIHNDEWTGN